MVRFAYLIDPIHRIRRLFQSRNADAAGLLIVAAGGLGDTVLFSLVAERFTKLATPTEPVTILLRDDSSAMAFCLPNRIKILSIDFKRFGRSASYRWKTVETLYKANYRLVISTDFQRHPFLDEAMIAATNAPENIAMFSRPWTKYDLQLLANQRLFTRLFNSGDIQKDKIIRWNDFANWITNTNELPPKVSLKRRFTVIKDQPKIREIIIQPFSAIAAKQVDARCYKALIEALPCNTKIRITGLQSDLESNPEIKSLISGPMVEFDPSPFHELIKRLQKACLVISVDTALMHLAVALGAPTLCLASAAYYGEIVPYAPSVTPDNVTFLYTDMPCAGCLGNCIHSLVEGRYLCVDGLNPEKVVKKALELLN